MHLDPSPLAGKTVKIKKEAIHPHHPSFGGSKIWIEDWWDRIAKKSWMDCDGNVACMTYGLRSGTTSLPLNNEVVYGKIDGFGYLVHVSEIEEKKMEVKRDKV